ncbi:hypothetical protein ACFQDG_14435 [Natronoarchaeum mannanilyticum]|uniref:Uncharacterized protein n=1 Tax=Natronoarchaeum mannanilyticum TaxID=926360 RepID=A0AAV3T728_9EURY
MSALGPTAFDLLVWGSIALVLVSFAYLTYQLVVDARHGVWSGSTPRISEF